MLANVALPSFLPHSLATLIGIFVIAAIEGWFVMRILKRSYAESYRHSLWANWMSTVVGIPVAWLLWIGGLIPVSMGLSLLGLKPPAAVSFTFMHTIASGGIIPSEWTGVASAVAWIVMLVPFWLGSVWIETRAIWKRLPACEPAQVKKAVVRGNLASYGIFLTIGLIPLTTALNDLPRQKAKYKERQEQRDQLRRERAKSSQTLLNRGKS